MLIDFVLVVIAIVAVAVAANVIAELITK